MVWLAGISYSVFVNSGSSANLLCLAWLKSNFLKEVRLLSRIYLEFGYLFNLLDGIRALIC